MFPLLLVAIVLGLLVLSWDVWETRKDDPWI